MGLGAMDLFFTTFVLVLVADQTRGGVSSKMDFGTDEEASEKPEDVEVKHTIIVSTKLNNNNRKGIHGSNNNNGEVTYNFGKSTDDAEVPVVKGFKAVETTRIRTPDTRNKPKTTEAVFVTRNLQDGYNLYPEFDPTQWKPSSLYNNINWWEANNVYVQPRDGTVKLQRKVTDEGMREFYCKRCRELSYSQGQYRKDCYEVNSVSSRRNYQSYQSTTPKVKIDGKLAKLN